MQYAYSTVPTKILTHIRDIFWLDFLYFDYDPEPDIIFADRKFEKRVRGSQNVRSVLKHCVCYCLCNTFLIVGCMCLLQKEMNESKERKKERKNKRKNYKINKERKNKESKFV